MTDAGSARNTAAALSFEVGVSRVGRATLRWRRSGTGPHVVFVPGFPLGADTWDGVVRRLAERFTCYSADPIGLGASVSEDLDDYSSQGQARRLRDLITILGISSYALVGNDAGGWIGRELVLLDQERVTHLVLTNTEIPGHRPPWIPLYQKLASVPGFGAMLRQLLRSRSFCRSSLAFGGCFHDRDRIDGVFRERYIDRLIRSPEAMENVVRFLRRMDYDRLDEFRDLHRAIDTPTAFLWGGDDPTFPVSRARGMLEQFPRVVRFQIAKDAKLFFQEEYPDLVATFVERFVTETPPSITAV